MQPRVWRSGYLQQRAARKEEHHGHQRSGDVVAEVERLHRVGIFLRLHDHHADDGAQQPERHDHERKQDTVDAERLEQQHTENHRADVLGGGALEQVGAAAGAIADIVAHEVGDHGGIARIVLGNARFHLADEVGSDVGSLGIDAAAELREQRDERRAKSVADDEEGDVPRPFARVHALRRHGRERREQAAHAEQAHCHREQAGHGAPAQRSLQRVVERRHCRSGHADVRADGDPHADVAGDRGTQCAEQERRRDVHRERLGILHGIIRCRVAEVAVADAQQRRDDERQQADRLVLPREVGFGSLLNGVGDLLHLGRPAAAGQHPARQEDCEDQRERAGADDDVNERGLRWRHVA